MKWTSHWLINPRQAFGVPSNFAGVGRRRDEEPDPAGRGTDGVAETSTCDPPATEDEELCIESWWASRPWRHCASCCWVDSACCRRVAMLCKIPASKPCPLFGSMRLEHSITDGEESESESWNKESVVLGYISLAGCMQDFLIGQAHRTIRSSCGSRSTVQRDKLGYSGKRIPQRQRPGPDEMTEQQHNSSQEPERSDVRIRLDTKPKGNNVLAPVGRKEVSEIPSGIIRLVPCSSHSSLGGDWRVVIMCPNPRWLPEHFLFAKRTFSCSQMTRGSASHPCQPPTAQTTSRGTTPESPNR